MNKPLMPRATALWLLNQTSLTSKQISEFCDIHLLALDVLKNSNTLQELDPIANHQLLREEIERCECDPQAKLTLYCPMVLRGKGGKKYTPLSKRADIPHAILWVVKNHPELPDAQICSILATTRTMVKNIRDGSYWNLDHLTPKNPVLIGLCREQDLLLPAQ
ncbi:MAG: DUF1013 domain-containing protein [Alphaproteobacteria bacterium]|nr:DUF1013 domain-containing protein [Alphaproteobacteria bacterium]